MVPTVIKGNYHKDERGVIRFNNNFVATEVKRMYTIENVDAHFIRAWQGHQIEQRWFSPILGIFKVKLIKIDDWNEPKKDLSQLEFFLNAKEFEVLHVPAGYVSSIQALEDESKLLVLADYQLGEIQDEYRFSPDYFNSK